MFGPPVLADCYTRPRGAVALRSSTPRTSGYSTELWPTYAYRPQIVLGTSVFDGFGPRLMHRHRHDSINSIRHIGDPRPTFVQPRQIWTDCDNCLRGASSCHVQWLCKVSLRSRYPFPSFGAKRKCVCPMAFMHIRHVGALVVVPALPMANRCRCTLVQDPSYFGLLNWTLAYLCLSAANRAGNMSFRRIRSQANA
jgi:hypothetical protein